MSRKATDDPRDEQLEVDPRYADSAWLRDAPADELHAAIAALARQLAVFAEMNKAPPIAAMRPALLAAKFITAELRRRRM